MHRELCVVGAVSDPPTVREDTDCLPYVTTETRANKTNDVSHEAQSDKCDAYRRLRGGNDSSLLNVDPSRTAKDLSFQSQLNRPMDRR